MDGILLALLRDEDTAAARGDLAEVLQARVSRASLIEFGESSARVIRTIRTIQIRVRSEFEGDLARIHPKFRNFQH